MTEVLRMRVGRAFRRTALPLAAYYTVTLVFPLANGAAQAGAVFAKHALIVLVVPAVAIVAGCAIHHAIASAAKRRGRGVDSRSTPSRVGAPTRQRST